jgi:hypothetical protein
MKYEEIFSELILRAALRAGIATGTGWMTEGSEFESQ